MHHFDLRHLAHDALGAARHLEREVKHEVQKSVSEVRQAMAQAPSPVVYNSYNGYACDETSDAWKTMCLTLPCFVEVQFPGYATAVYYQSIAGVPAVVQLWKGRCERFGGARWNFPGGVGAEVGIYRQKHPGDSTWYPAPELNTRLSWRLVNPSTGQDFLASLDEQTYWCNRWMTMDAYQRYTRDQNGRVPNYTGYTLIYKINGMQQLPW